MEQHPICSVRFGQTYLLSQQNFVPWQVKDKKIWVHRAVYCISNFLSVWNLKLPLQEKKPCGWSSSQCFKCAHPNECCEQTIEPVVAGMDPHILIGPVFSRLGCAIEPGIQLHCLFQKRRDNWIGWSSLNIPSSSVGHACLCLSKRGSLYSIMRLRLAFAKLL